MNSDSHEQNIQDQLKQIGHLLARKRQFTGPQMDRFKDTKPWLLIVLAITHGYLSDENPFFEGPFSKMNEKNEMLGLNLETKNEFDIDIENEQKIE